MKPDNGQTNSDHLLLEQYKLYVEMADRVSQRRDQSNRFYATLVAAFVALLVVMARLDVSTDTWSVVFTVVGAFGMAFSIVWFINIRSYRELNSAKFQIINDMEKLLPYAGYSKEWEILRPPGDSPRYIQLTRVEQFVPAVFFVFFLALLIYGAYRLMSG